MQDERIRGTAGAGETPPSAASPTPGADAGAAGDRGWPAGGAAEPKMGRVDEVEHALRRRQLDRLTEQELDEAGGRAALARKVAERYEISVREAKRRVRDLDRALRMAKGGRTAGGKRARKIADRAAAAITDAAWEIGNLARGLGKVLSRSSLPGLSGSREPLPGGDLEEAAATAEALPGESGAVEPLPGESGAVEPLPGDDDERPSGRAESGAIA